MYSPFLLFCHHQVILNGLAVWLKFFFFLVRVFHVMCPYSLFFFFGFGLIWFFGKMWPGHFFLWQISCYKFSMWHISIWQMLPAVREWICIFIQPVWCFYSDQCSEHARNIHFNQAFIAHIVWYEAHTRGGKETSVLFRGPNCAKICNLVLIFIWPCWYLYGHMIFIWPKNKMK